mgnify:CR=1 FL=1
MKFNRGRHAIWASRDDVKNSAPHKPVLMLAVVKMYNLGVYNSHNYNGTKRINDDLVEHFKQIGNIIKAPNLDIHLPFFHLKNEKDGYWHHIYTFQGAETPREKPPKSKSEMFERYVGVTIGSPLKERLDDMQMRPELAREIIIENFDSKYLEPLIRYLDFSRAKYGPYGIQADPSLSTIDPDFDHSN